MAATKSLYNKLQKNSKAPFFKLQGTDGRMHSLLDFKNAKAVLIVFMCNHCPYVKPKMDAINKLQMDFKDKGLIVIGINSNSAKIVPEDDFDHMTQIAKEKNFTFLYLHDETQEVARAYGASCTPDPFFLDKDQKLIFHSRLDSHHAEVLGNAKEMREAVSEYLAKGSISKQEEPSLGCSIKWNQ